MLNNKKEIVFTQNKDLNNDLLSYDIDNLLGYAITKVRDDIIIFVVVDVYNVLSTAAHNCINGTGCLTNSGCYKPTNDTNSNDHEPAVCPFDCSDDCVTPINMHHNLKIITITCDHTRMLDILINQLYL